MSQSYERPRQRKGYVLTAVQWDRDGRVRGTTYEPIRKARPVEDEAPARPSRGALAVERDLFSQS